MLTESSEQAEVPADVVVLLAHAIGNANLTIFHAAVSR